MEDLAIKIIIFILGVITGAFLFWVFNTSKKMEEPYEDDNYEDDYEEVELPERMEVENESQEE